MLAGWSPRRLSLTAYALMIAAGASALVALGRDEEVQCAIIFVWGAVYVSLLLAIERRAARPRAVS